MVVWDGMGGKDGAPTTAKFMSGLLQSLPPLQSIFESAGMNLPSILDVSKKPVEEEKESKSRKDFESRRPLPEWQEGLSMMERPVASAEGRSAPQANFTLCL